MSSEVSSASPIRPDARRAHIYNDGLVVYLYDESFQKELEKERAWQKFSESLTSANLDAAMKDFLTSKRCAAYELYQDDEVVVDVCVGPPLEPAELKSKKGVVWQKAVATLLNLPSGKLCIESGNSCRIGAEDINEKGAILALPPGEYLLTLYRVDWAEMEDAEGPWAVLGDTIVLTPIAQAKPPKKYSAAIPYPVKKPQMKWLGAYTIKGRSFKAQACFPDCWEFMDLNLDRAAYETLGLGVGDVLDVELQGRNFVFVIFADALQYGLAGLSSYKLILGKDRATAALAQEKDVVFAKLTKAPRMDTEIVRGMRVNAKENWPKSGKWVKATGGVRPEKLTFPDFSEFGKWTQHETSVDCTVFLVADRLMTVNLEPAALEAIGIKPRAMLTIQAGGREQRALYTASPADAVKEIKARSELSGDARKAYMDLRAKLYGVAEAEKAGLLDSIRTMFLSDPPLVAYFDTHWADSTKPVLVVMPIVGNKDSIGLTFHLGLPCVPGGSVIVRT